MTVAAPTLVDAVEWRSVLADLAADADDVALAFAGRCASSVRIGSRAVALLAALVVVRPLGRVVTAVTAAGRLDDDQAEVLAAWTVDAATMFHRVALGPGAVSVPVEAAAVPVAVVGGSGGRLRLSPSIAAADLPLLPLAGDLAGRLGGLSVVAGHVGPAAAGCYSHRDRVVVLDLAQLDRDALAAAWAHELAHALDDRLAVAGGAEAEAFAERLAPLLALHEPASVAAAAPHVAVARVAADAARVPATGALPAPGIESLYVFATLIGAPS